MHRRDAPWRDESGRDNLGGLGWLAPTSAGQPQLCRVRLGSRRLLLDESQAEVLTGRIAAGLIVAIERPFSTSRRLRIGRRIRADVLTLLGRSDLGPIVGSHPAWFLNDAAGIPLPSVDLRPLNPTDGAPLNIGWEVVDSAEMGVSPRWRPRAARWSKGGFVRSDCADRSDWFLFPAPRRRCGPPEAGYLPLAVRNAPLSKRSIARPTRLTKPSRPLSSTTLTGARSRRSIGNPGIPSCNRASCEKIRRIRREPDWESGSEAVRMAPDDRTPG